MYLDKIKSKIDWQLIIILFTYLVLGLLLLNLYQYILNSDGISYINIAQKYMVGDFQNAINGYWGPLLSWLMIPFLYLSSDPLKNLYLTKILTLLFGFFTIIGAKLLADKFDIKGRLQYVFLVSLIPLILIFSLFDITPDLLMVCFLIFYLSYLFDDKYCSNIKNGVFCGLFGGLAFLTKSYAFVFFILHFTFFNIFYYFNTISPQSKRNLIKNCLIGLSIFFIISGAWIGVISDKYGYLTIGTTGKYNYELVGPQSQGHPMFYQGLIKPPNNSAISSWEDPSYFNMKPWSPLNSMINFKYQLELIWDNIIKIIKILEIYSIFSILILIVALLFIFKTPNAMVKRRILSILITLVIFSGIYSLILVELRYLWLIDILLILLTFYIIKELKLSGLNKFRANILLLLLIIFFIIGPIQELVTNIYAEENIYDLSQILHNNYDINGNIASNDKWEITDIIAYFLNSRYYGITTNNSDIISVTNQLNKNNIDYYLVWNNNEILMISGYKEITDGKIPFLKIYQKLR